MVGSLYSFLIVFHAPTRVACQISRSDDLFLTLLHVRLNTVPCMLHISDLTRLTDKECSLTYTLLICVFDAIRNSSTTH